MKGRRLAIGEVAPDFDLPGVDGKRCSLKSFQDKKALVVMFTCNHCPTVQAYEDRLIAIQRDYAKKGVQLIAICSNDTHHYPEDSLKHMVERARRKGYNFPYLRDDTQQAAEAYGAEYTPEVFVLDEERRLRYTGRIDDNREAPKKVRSHDLREALDALLEGREVENPETFAFGCTIKWS